MLTQIPDPRQFLEEFPFEPIRHYTFSSSLRRVDFESPAAPMLLQAESPHSVLIAIFGARLIFALARACSSADLLAAMHDLRAGLVSTIEGQWPPRATLAEWQRYGSPYYFFDTAPMPVFQAAIEAGMLPTETESHSQAALFALTGKPRFSHLIRHSCRLGRGLELLEPLIRGVHYDPEGNYIRHCLQQQLSYVCEQAGQPVCWSTNHLNNSMGMIYTPEEHRRQGYARSLAAFQIDERLRSEGVAIAHVVDGNTASSTLLLSLGAVEEPELKVCWRSLHPNP